MNAFLRAEMLKRVNTVMVKSRTIALMMENLAIRPKRMGPPLLKPGYFPVDSVIIAEGSQDSGARIQEPGVRRRSKAD
jgi:hypothetical protein